MFKLEKICSSLDLIADENDIGEISCPRILMALSKRGLGDATIYLTLYFQV